MSIQPNDTKDLELAHGFARAYREIDAGAMHALLAPGTRIRILMPRGTVEHEGAEALLDYLREFAAKWSFEAVDSVEVDLLSQNLLQTGRLVSIGQRLRLRSAAGDRTATMLMWHLVAIKDGRIALVDELCTGLMPETR